MALVRFDQEDGLPFGVGTFHGDDGSSFFGEDPEMATQLSPELQAAAAPPEDDRMAMNDEQKVQAGLFGAPGQAPPAPPPSKADVQPAMYNSNAPPTVQPAMTWNEHPPAPAQADADQLQANIDKVATRKRYDAPRAGGVVPTTQQETREASGMPYDPNGPEAMARADASINVNLAGQRKAEMESARAAGEEAAYRAALPQLEEQARVAQMRRDMQERQYRRDREDLEKAVEQSNKSAKSFDANRWFNDRGAIGGIGAAIAQAVGAGAAALTGGPNVVLQQINSYIDRDIMSQRAAIEADEKGANNALAQLNRQYGNLDQAESALRIIQQKKVETMAGAYAASTKSQDVMAAYDMWVAGNNERRVADEQKFQNAAYGKVSVQTAAKVVPASRGGWRDPTTAEMTKDYEMLDKRGKVIEGTYDAEIKRQKSLGNDPEKKSKESELVIENLDGSLVLARKPDEATKIREMRALHTNASGAVSKLKGLAKSGSSLSPDDLRSVDINIEAVVNGANTIAGQNAVKGEDMERYKKALKSTVGSMPAEKALSELQDILDRSYQARVDAQRGSAVNVAETGSGQRVKYTGKASKNPTANVPVLRKIGGK